MIFLQLMMVTALALLFSTFSSPMLATALTFGLYIVGHFNADLKHFETVVTLQAGRPACARAVLPAAESGAARHQGPGSCTRCRCRPGYLLLNTAYALVYIGALLVAATLIFMRRDFK